MSIRLILWGKVKDDSSGEAFGAMAKRAAAFSEADEAITTHNFYLSDDGRYWEEEVFADEPGFFTHLAAATEAGIIDEYLAVVDLDGVFVLDPVGDDVRTALEQWGAVHLELAGGF